VAFLSSPNIRWILLFVLSVKQFPAYSQQDTVIIEPNKKVISSIGAGLQKGFIFAHSQAV
jgi:hypothetical protein